MLQQFEAGKITENQVRIKTGIYAQTEKRAKLILQGMALAAKYKKPVLDRLVKINLIGDGTAIDMGAYAFENEKIKCPLKDDNTITREECLTFSGEEKNFDDCQLCDHFKVTRDILMGDIK